MRRALFLTALLALSIFTALASPVSSETSNVAIDFTGDTTIAIGSTNHYVLNLTGGPAATGGTWDYNIIPIYENSTGSPKVEPKNMSSEDNVFHFNFTAPDVGQVVKLKIVAESRNVTDTSSSERIIDIKVVKPILIKAKVFNEGDVAVNQAKVYFYANSGLISTKYVDVPANTDRTLWVNYTTYVEGANKITIKIDPENEVLKLAGGTTEISKTIYYKEDAGKFEGLYMLGVFVMVIMLLWTANWTRKKVRGY
jgi:hypothetical protein